MRTIKMTLVFAALTSMTTAFSPSFAHADELPAPAAKTAAATPVKAEQPVTVDVKFARSIDKRLPIDASESFTAGGKVYCWNEVKGIKGEGSISHRWYRDGKQIVEIPISVRSMKWRTWSFMNAVPGSYKVEITGEGGEVLKTAEFTVAKETRVSVKQPAPPTTVTR
jgi:hypothetical protein